MSGLNKCILSIMALMNSQSVFSNLLMEKSALFSSKFYSENIVVSIKQFLHELDTILHACNETSQS